MRDEELIINGVSIFRCDFLNREYRFDNLKCVDAETANVDRYLQALEGDETTEENIEPKLPFLRWLISNVALKNDSVLIRLSNYVRRMIMITVGNEMPYRVRRMSNAFYESLENPERLKDLEDFLNAIRFANIMIYNVYKKIPHKLPVCLPAICISNSVYPIFQLIF